jgi:hypothetical protein
MQFTAARFNARSVTWPEQRFSLTTRISEAGEVDMARDASSGEVRLGAPHQTVEELDSGPVIAVDNAARYTLFVVLVEAVDVGRAADLGRGSLVMPGTPETSLDPARYGTHSLRRTKSHADLQANEKHQSNSASARTHEAGEHCPLGLRWTTPWRFRSRRKSDDRFRPTGVSRCSRFGGTNRTFELAGFRPRSIANCIAQVARYRGKPTACDCTFGLDKLPI